MAAFAKACAFLEANLTSSKYFVSRSTNVNSTPSWPLPMTVSARAGGPVPVTGLGVGINDGWSLLNTNSVGDELPLAGLAAFLVMLAVADAQILRKFFMVSGLFGR